jgi:signal transduction histidine kinase
LRISGMVYAGVVLLVGIIVWLAQGRYAQLDAIESDFLRLTQVSRTSRLAAVTGERLAALSAAIREYVASEAIEPPPRVAQEAQTLLASLEGSRSQLPREKFEIDRVEREVSEYLASFEAVATARRQRQARLARLAAAAALLRDQAEAAGQQARFLKLREAELQYLMARSAGGAGAVNALATELAAALPRHAADAAGTYAVAFGRVVEIYDLLDQATVRVLDEHDAKLRAFTQELGSRAQVEEERAVASFRSRLEVAVQRNVEVSIVAVLLALAGAVLLLRMVIHPLNRMTSTMTGIAGGEYALTIPYGGRRDEVGQMARALTLFKNALLGIKAAQAQAEMASKHKSEFLANMTHELRTPLNAILGLSAMLLEDADDPEPRELRESLTRITVSARHLLDLINEILDLSKIEAGRMNIVVEAFSPAALAEEALATVAPMAREKNLALRSAYAAGLPALHSDPQRVRQILINLLANAVKFTDDGEVRLAVGSTPAGLRFSVTDTGPGMAADDLAKLFQEFTQLDASRTRKYGGTGLGLAISRRMARLLGGDISVQSTPGAGSTFVLMLPLQAPAELTAADPAAPQALPDGAAPQAPGTATGPAAGLPAPHLIT